MPQQNVELVRRAMEVANRRDVDALDDIATVDYEWQNAPRAAGVGDDLLDAAAQLGARHRQSLDRTAQAIWRATLVGLLLRMAGRNATIPVAIVEAVLPFAHGWH